MAVQRKLFEPSFAVWPDFPCPVCRIGILEIDENAIDAEENAASRAEHDHPAWEPEWIQGRFNATLLCVNPNCKERIFVIGETKIQHYQFLTDDGEWHEGHQTSYLPHYFEPTLSVFSIPDECPEEVAKELKEAFQLLWSDIGSSGNRLRVAVETLLNERKIPAKAKIKKGRNRGKFRDLSLHGRIDKFAERELNAANQLMAIKWLGNIGSHAVMDKLTRTDLLDAFEHFEYALDLVYVRKAMVLERRARDINKKKGPVRAKK